MKNLKTNVFRNCTSLKEITLPENLQAIWYFVFAGCSSLETVTFGENLKFSGYNNFIDCEKLHSLYLPITKVTQTYPAELPHTLFYGMPERKSGRRKAVIYVKKDSPFHQELKDFYSNVVQVKNDKK